jgi:hypothetical protein
VTVLQRACLQFSSEFGDFFKNFVTLAHGNAFYL